MPDAIDEQTIAKRERLKALFQSGDFGKLVEALNEGADADPLGELEAVYYLLKEAMPLALKHLGDLSTFDQWAFWQAFDAVGKYTDLTWYETNGDNDKRKYTNAEITNALSNDDETRFGECPFDARYEFWRQRARASEDRQLASTDKDST